MKKFISNKRALKKYLSTLTVIINSDQLQIKSIVEDCVMYDRIPVYEIELLSLISLNLKEKIEVF